VTSLDAARSRRTRRWAIGLGVAAALALVVTVGAVALRPGGNTSGEAGGRPEVTSTSVTGTSSTGQAVVANPNNLLSLIPQVTQTASAGPFSDPARLSACLAANGVKDTNVLGVLAVTYVDSSGNSHDAYAISLGLEPARARILIVGPQCGNPNADLLDQKTAGG
jgi:hypothetical protein